MAEKLSGKDFSFHLKKQATQGVVPATPDFDEVRRVSGRAVKTLDFVQSEEVKTNNQGLENITDKETIGAEISAETTKQSIDLLISAMKDAETVFTVTASDIQFTATDISAAAGTPFAGIDVGDFIFVSGSTSNNRTFKVTAKADDQNMTLSPSPTIEAAGASITVDSNRTKTGTTRQLYLGQTRTYDESLGGDNTSYRSFYDGFIGSMTLEVGETGIVTNTVNMSFEREIAGEAIIAGQTDNQKDSSNVISSANGITQFWDGSTIQDCVIASMSVDLQNNPVEVDIAACPTEYSNGQMVITSSITAINRVDNSLKWMRDYESTTTHNIAVEINHGNGDITILEIKKGKITEHTIDDGKDVVASSQMTLGAEEDALGETFVLTRNWV